MKTIIAQDNLMTGVLRPVIPRLRDLMLVAAGLAGNTNGGPVLRVTTYLALSCGGGNRQRARCCALVHGHGDQCRR